MRLSVNERSHFKTTHVDPVRVVVGTVRIDKARRIAKRIINLAKNLVVEFFVTDDVYRLRRFLSGGINLESLSRDAHSFNGFVVLGSLRGERKSGSSESDGGREFADQEFSLTFVHFYGVR